MLCPRHATPHCECSSFASIASKSFTHCVTCCNALCYRGSMSSLHSCQSGFSQLSVNTNSTHSSMTHCSCPSTWLGGALAAHTLAPPGGSTTNSLTPCDGEIETVVDEKTWYRHMSRQFCSDSYFGLETMYISRPVMSQFRPSVAIYQPMECIPV